MSRFRWLFAAGWLPFVFIVSMPAAQERDSAGPAAVSAEDVRRLVDELNSASRRARISAESQLIELGEAVVPLLTPDTERAPAVQAALQRIVETIERSAAARLLEESRVTLTEPLTVEETLERIREQTSNTLTLVDASPALKRLSLTSNLEAVPFWLAVDQVCREAGLGWEWREETTLAFSPDLTVPAGRMRAVDGFRISVESPLRRRNFAAPELRRLLRLNVRIDVEPRLHPFYLSVADRDFVVGNETTSLSPFSPEAQREFPFLSGQSVMFSVDLKRDPDQPLESASLRGHVAVRCAAKRVPLTFSLSDETTERLRAGHTEVERLDVSRTVNGEWEATLRIQFGQAGPELESHRLGTLHRDAWLDLSSGERVRYRELQLLRVEGAAHTVRYTFPASAEDGDLRLTYLAPVLITTVEVPFEIVDIPLPP